ncbi:MAG: hypothetical protein LBD50_00530 [Rickettsiales bacterium]|nr:hypothetical protein [Rickettsiales bacterium]
MKKLSVSVCLVLAVCAAQAGISIQNQNSIEPEFLLVQLTAERDALKEQIAAIDAEQARCKKQKTGWTAATVVGSIGVVGTGIGAIVQGNAIKNKKEELGDNKEKLNQLKQQ